MAGLSQAGKHRTARPLSATQNGFGPACRPRNSQREDPNALKVGCVQPKLRHVGASPRTLDYRSRRNLDKSAVQQLPAGKWDQGPAQPDASRPLPGSATWLACAWHNAACPHRNNRASTKRLPRCSMIGAWPTAHGRFRAFPRPDKNRLADPGTNLAPRDRLNAKPTRDLYGDRSRTAYEADQFLITRQHAVDCMA